MRTDTLGVDWEALLAEDGSLPFTPHVISLDDAEPAPKPAPRQRKRHDDGIDVVEGTSIGLTGIVDATLFFETRWRCPKCRKTYSKVGRHTGTLKTCRTPGCHARFFLRMVPVK